MSLIKHKLNGFTLAEVIITLALTSLVITFAYGTLSYVEKLFFSYKDQNRFMQEYTSFKTRMDHEALFCDWIIEEQENTFMIKRDSTFNTLKLLNDMVLLKNKEFTDTFHFTPKLIAKEYEPMPQSIQERKLLRQLKFEVEYSKQKFNFYFAKSYDASEKLKLYKVQ